jgi:hypothetical protein
MTAGPALPGALSTTCVQKAPTNALREKRLPPRAERAAGGRHSLVALLATLAMRGRTSGYAASAFFEDDDLSDFFDESDDEDESLFESFFDSLFSPPSLPLRSISRLRRLVP